MHSNKRYELCTAYGVVPRAYKAAHTKSERQNEPIVNAKNQLHHARHNCVSSRTINGNAGRRRSSATSRPHWQRPLLRRENVQKKNTRRGKKHIHLTRSLARSPNIECQRTSSFFIVSLFLLHFECTSAALAAAAAATAQICSVPKKRE